MDAEMEWQFERQAGIGGFSSIQYSLDYRGTTHHISVVKVSENSYFIAMHVANDEVLNYTESPDLGTFESLDEALARVEDETRKWQAGPTAR